MSKAKAAEKISAYRGEQTREFDRHIWDQLPADKYGWKRKADKPEEVSNLEKGSTSKKPSDKNGSSVKGKEEKKLNASELAKQIYAAESAEGVDALVPDGETRATVLKAAEARKEQLKAQ